MRMKRKHNKGSVGGLPAQWGNEYIKICYFY